MFCFSILVNSTTLKDLVMRLGLLKCLYYSKKVSINMKSAYNRIVDIINDLNKKPLFPDIVNNDTLSESNEDSEQFNSFSHDEMSLKLQPFSMYFNRKMEEVHVHDDDDDNGEKENRNYNPDYFNELLTKWLPMAPFWTCMLLGKCLKFTM